MFVTMTERNGGRAREYRQRTGSLDGSTNVCANISVRHNAGGISKQTLFQAAIAVIRGTAKVLGPNGKPVPQIAIVICRRVSNRRDAGATVNAIDAGEHCDSYILPWSTERSPTIPKASCRLANEACSHSIDECCKSCCNFPKKKK